MADWIPQRTAIALAPEALSGDEALVLARVDGATSVETLRRLTGAPAARLDAILARLVAAGALAPAPRGLPRAPTEALDPSERETDPPDEEAAPDDRAVGAARRVYEIELRHLPVDRRAELARSAKGVTLAALCFDADPRIVRGVLENPDVALLHARLIAAHHGNPVGLDALAARAAFLRDAEVQRALLRNPQASEAVLLRFLAGRRIAVLYPLSRSRELTERAKNAVRQAFRRAFERAEADERVALIFGTEGRCLASLAGVPLDAKSTALLSARPCTSTLLVQSLARWGGTPPGVLAHLLRQPLVQRSPQLRQLVVQHANCPRELKRPVR